MSEQAKVAFVNQPFDHLLPPHQNSIGIWTYQVAQHLCQTFDVTCYAKLMRVPQQAKKEHQPGTRPNQARMPDGQVNIRFISMLPIRFWSAAERCLSRLFTRQKPFFAFWATYLDYVLPIALDIRRKGIQFVHIHNFPQFGAIIRAFNPEATIILHMHCEWLSQLEPALMTSYLKKVDLIVGSSDHIGNLIKESYPQWVDRIHVLPNGVDIEQFAPAPVQHGSVHATRTGHSDEGTQALENNVHDEAQPHLLFVGRVSPEKGIHVLIDALSIVARTYPGTHLTIVGPEGEVSYDYLVGISTDPLVTELAQFYQGSYWQLLHQRIPESLKSQVTFTGPIAQSELLSFYLSADVLINPSFSESFGMSLIEAMACGQAVIASQVGGMTTIVEEGKTGLLVEQGNAKLLAESILFLLNNQETRLDMGRAGRDRAVDLYAWPRVAALWQALVAAPAPFNNQ